MEDKNLKQITEYIELPETNQVAMNPDLPAPEQGKAWKRISDGFIFYGELFLGELHYRNGKKLKTPVKEKIEDFELVEIDQE